VLSVVEQFDQYTPLTIRHIQVVGEQCSSMTVAQDPFSGVVLLTNPSLKNISIFRDGSIKRIVSKNIIFKDDCLCQPSLKMSDFHR